MIICLEEVFAVDVGGEILSNKLRVLTARLLIVLVRALVCCVVEARKTVMCMQVVIVVTACVTIPNENE